MKALSPLLIAAQILGSSPFMREARAEQLKKRTKIPGVFPEMKFQDENKAAEDAAAVDENGQPWAPIFEGGNRVPRAKFVRYPDNYTPKFLTKDATVRTGESTPRSCAPKVP